MRTPLLDGRCMPLHRNENGVLLRRRRAHDLANEMIEQCGEICDCHASEIALINLVA